MHNVPLALRSLCRFCGPLRSSLLGMTLTTLTVLQQEPLNTWRQGRNNRTEHPVPGTCQCPTWRRHIQVERPCCSRDLVLRDGVATAHDLGIKTETDKRNPALSSLILIALDRPRSPLRLLANTIGITG